MNKETKKQIVGMLDWLNDAPEIVQNLAAKYPPGYYIIKQGTPYGISCAGTKVLMYGYLEDGNVQVIVEAKNKLPEAIEHENELGQKHGRSGAEMKRIHDSDTLVTIDPVWLDFIN